jgi:hypothetical protein
MKYIVTDHAPIKAWVEGVEIEDAAMSDKQHFLKTDPDCWDAISDDRKTADFRKDDREFEVNDLLILKRGTFEGVGEGFRYCYRVITHIVRGPAFGIPEGYAMLSLKPVSRV